ncbi:MAG: FtsX-like permease family protein [bacterium]|jgi:putative ABC transport system permease protein|nr:FtsX-like permease family protein [candidate division KSB1 bacterium]MDH7559459.1 FtsX-like permease family protein [bacterium]
MIGFLVKGLVRDPSRSLFPFLIVALGVMLTVFLHGWLGGVMHDFLDTSARFSTGHVRVVTRAYAELEDQFPNDLALVGVDELLGELRQREPDLDWVARIRFAALVDVPNEQGETRAQGQAIGLAADLLSSDNELHTLNVAKALVRGELPSRAGYVLLSEELAQRLGLAPGDRLTLISSTMYGGMATGNFLLAGTVRFGVGPVDRGALLMDLADARQLLDMEDAASEIFGLFRSKVYRDSEAVAVAQRFNRSRQSDNDEFAPMMLTLGEQQGLGEYLDYVETFSGIMVFVFVMAMSLVLWNAGLLGGLRRHGEVGVRLAIGEDKGHVYRSMLAESACIGIAGSVTGTLLGLAIVSVLQVKGIDMGRFFKGSSLMIPGIVRARITPATCYLGFIPGLFSTLLGTALSGIRIYKRNTAQLFKEFEG